MSEQEKPTQGGMSRTVVHAQITLTTTESQRLFKRVFERTDTALMWLDTIYDRMSAVEQFSGVFESLDNRLSAVMQVIEDGKAQMAQLAEEEGPADIEVEHTAPQRLPANISHPVSMKLMRLFTAFDAYMQEVNSLWILGILNRPQKKEAAARVRKGISEICLTIMRTNSSAQALYRKAKAAGLPVTRLADTEDEADTEFEEELPKAATG